MTRANIEIDHQNFWKALGDPFLAKLTEINFRKDFKYVGVSNWYYQYFFNKTHWAHKCKSKRRASFMSCIENIGIKKNIEKKKTNNQKDRARTTKSHAFWRLKIRGCIDLFRVWRHCLEIRGQTGVRVWGRGQIEIVQIELRSKDQGAGGGLKIQIHINWRPLQKSGTFSLSH